MSPSLGSTRCVLGQEFFRECLTHLQGWACDPYARMFSGNVSMGKQAMRRTLTDGVILRYASSSSILAISGCSALYYGGIHDLFMARP